LRRVKARAFGAREARAQGGTTRPTGTFAPFLNRLAQPT
jgi:hypothetical protein